MNEMKRCVDCGELVPLGEFPIRKRKGKRPIPLPCCRECHRARKRRYRRTMAEQTGPHISGRKWKAGLGIDQPDSDPPSDLAAVRRHLDRRGQWVRQVRGDSLGALCVQLAPGAQIVDGRLIGVAVVL